eukprot:scaffold593031_cov22-Prasinocladus_malaysianus.AAC.1
MSHQLAPSSRYCWALWRPVRVACWSPPERIGKKYRTRTNTNTRTCMSPALDMTHNTTFKYQYVIYWSLYFS